MTQNQDMPVDDTPHEKTLRLAERLRGLLKEEFAAYGGGEAYLRWVHGYDEPEEDAWARAERCGRP